MAPNRGGSFREVLDDYQINLLPSHLEAGETICEALAREAKEEIGLTIKVPSRPQFTFFRTFSEISYLDFFFIEIVESGIQPKNCEPHKCKKIKWYPTIQPPLGKTAPYILYVLEKIHHGVTYAERKA